MYVFDEFLEILSLICGSGSRGEIVLTKAVDKRLQRCIRKAPESSVTGLTKVNNPLTRRSESSGSGSS